MHPTSAYEFFHDNCTKSEKRTLPHELLHGKYRNVSLIASGNGNTNAHKQIHASILPSAADRNDGEHTN